MWLSLRGVIPSDEGPFPLLNGFSKTTAFHLLNIFQRVGENFNREADFWKVAEKFWGVIPLNQPSGRPLEYRVGI